MTRVAAGNYFVGFPSSTAGELLLATPQWQTADFNRTVQVAQCGGSSESGANVSCSVDNDTNHVFVQTWQGTLNTDGNFYVSVIG